MSVHRLRFSFSQQGLPTEELPGGLRSSTHGRGYVTFSRPLRPGSLGFFEGPATVGSGERFVHVDRLGRRTLRLVLMPVGAGVAAFADGSRLVALTVRVLASNDPGCPRGREGNLTLEDARSGAELLRLYLCPTDHEHHYANGVRGTVQVVIG
jgi:hypothetical protein